MGKVIITADPIGTTCLKVRLKLKIDVLSYETTDELVIYFVAVTRPGVIVTPFNKVNPST